MIITKPPRANPLRIGRVDLWIYGQIYVYAGTERPDYETQSWTKNTDTNCNCWKTN